MRERLAGSLITIAVGLCGYLAAIHWHDEAPLLIDATPACAAPNPAPNPCSRVNCNRPNTRLFA